MDKIFFNQNRLFKRRFYFHFKKKSKGKSSLENTIRNRLLKRRFHFEFFLKLIL